MELPRVKHEHRASRIADRTVRIGGGVYGIAAEIEDPHGWVSTALDLMDGTRTQAELVNGLRSAFPALPEAGAARLVRELLATGYVEEAGVSGTEPDWISPADRDRYQRNQAFFRHADLRPQPSAWEDQRRLREAAVVVLGVGGTGSHAAWALAAAGVGRIHLIDHDRVEASNLTRQALYTEADIGRPKAETAAERLRAVNSSISVTSAMTSVDNEAALAGLLAGFDVLALCADEPLRDTLWGWASSACAQAAMPWVGGGYNGPLITIGTFAPGGPCFRCLTRTEEELLPGQQPPYLGGAGAIAPSAGIAGQLVAYEVIGQITGLTRSTPGYVRGINLVAPEHLVLVRHGSRRECEACGV